MIREIPNRYEKLNFSSDDIQQQLETHSQGTPMGQGGASQATIKPTFSKQVITRESGSILDSQLSSSDQSSHSSSASSSHHSSRNSSISSRGKSIDELIDDPVKQKKDKKGKKELQNKFSKISFQRMPTNSNNITQPTQIKESLINPFTLVHSKEQYYIQSNGQNFRKRRLLSFQGEETGEFRELVTFLDKVQKNDEMPAHKMIRKNSCCCVNCGVKSTKQTKLDKLIPKFKPTQVIRMMYRKAFQKTINNISKINKFFRSKLQIRTKNNNNFVFGEKKASPTKFMRQSTFKISPKSIDKSKQVRPSKESPECLQKFQALNMSKQPNSLQLQSSNSQNDTPNSILDKRKSKQPTLIARNSLFVYSDGEQHQQFLSKLQQLPSPFKRSTFNSTNANANVNTNSDQKSQQPNVTNNNTPSIPPTNQETNIDKQGPPKLSNTSSNISVGSQQGANSGNANNNSNPNTPSYPKKSLAISLEQLKVKNTTSNIVVEDKIIDQLRQETKMGNINNDFVKSVGSNILRQSLNNIPQTSELESDRQKSRRTDVILEDASEIGHQSEKSKIHRNLFVSSYYRHIPKLSNKYMHPVLSQMNLLKRDENYNNHSQFNFKTLGEINSDASLEKKHKQFNNQSTMQLDSRNTTQASEVGRGNQLQPKIQNPVTLLKSSSTKNFRKNNKHLQYSCSSLGISPATNFNSNFNNVKPKNEGHKKIQMKRKDKINIFTQGETFESVYLQSANNSCTNSTLQKQQSQIHQRPPFNLSQKNEFARTNTVSLLPSKLREQSNLSYTPKPHNKFINSKSSLPDINLGAYQKSKLSQQTSHKQNQSKEPIQVQQQYGESFDQFPSTIINLQSKEDLSPFKKESKKKRLPKSKSNSQSKNMLQIMDMYQKQSN